MSKLNSNYTINYDKRSKTLYREDESGSKVPLWEDLLDISIHRDIDTNEQTVFIKAVCRGKTFDKNIPVSDLQSNKFVRYSNYGYPVLNKTNRELIIQWFEKNISNFKLINVTSDIGWKVSDNLMWFQLQQAISHDNSIKARYNGDLHVRTKGNFDEYSQLIHDYVLPNIATQTIIAFSVSSALASYLNKDLTLILHMNGESSTGKTTMLKLAASVWGSTKVDTNGIIRTWNATSNATVNSLCGINGITICLDELSVTDADKENLTYIISGGSDKLRMGEYKSKPFSVNLCSSGEIPMKTVEGINGTDVRLLEFCGVQWTTDAEHSWYIQNAVENNCGLLGQKFVKILLKQEKESLSSRLEGVSNKIKAGCQKKLNTLSNKQKRIVERTIDKIAVISLSAILLKKHMKLDFAPEAIAKFMLKKSQLFSISDYNCIEMVEAFINQMHVDNIKAHKKHITLSTSYKIIEKNGYLCVPEEEFYKTLKSLGYNRETVLANIKELISLDIIRGENGGNGKIKPYNRHTVNSKRLHFIDLSIEHLKKEGVDID